MSLEEDRTGENIDLGRPTASEMKKSTKRSRAEELALKYKELPYDQRMTKIKEEVPCSKSVAWKAIDKIDKSQKREKEPSRGGFKVLEEEHKEPEFMPSEAEQKKKEEPEKIEKREAEPKIEELTAEEVQEQLDIFRDMLRGTHQLILSKDGLLGERYGRKPEQVEQASDQLYRWLRRRYGLEDLERWDTVLLVGSYGTLIGGIIKDYIQDRRKKEKEEKKEEKK